VLRERLGDERVQLFGDRVHTRIDREADAKDAAALLEREGLSVESVRAIPPTLEDVFIERLASAAQTDRRASS
jgi:hypothetical protein